MRRVFAVIINVFVLFSPVRSVSEDCVPAMDDNERMFFESIRNDDVIRFGVLPLQSPTKLARMFMPLLDYLKDKTGKEIAFITAPDFTRFMQRYESGYYDIVYSNPYQYVRARNKQGYRVFARVAGEPFTGLFIVKRGGSIREINSESLKGKTIAFVHPYACASALMSTAYLIEKGVDPSRDMSIKYVGSQDSVILSVKNGMVDIGVTWRPSLRLMESLKNDIEVIAETFPQPQMPISVHPRVSTETELTIRNLLITLGDSEEGRGILNALELPMGFAEASDEEYEDVRTLAKKLNIPF